MIKRYSFSLVVLISLVFVGCNKDEDIIIDQPIDNHPGSDSSGSQEIELDYQVVEYTPAPGQFINESVSGFNDINTPAEACRQASKRFEQGLYVSLGSWGGYIIIKFNHSIENTGDFDFAVGSNNFDSSNEPGIVWVMQDVNGNGLPDDVWYELRGSHFGKEGYERNYWVTYKRPKAKGNTPWEDSNGETGQVAWVGNFHAQEFYYPNWVKSDSYTLYGSRLPLQAVQDPATGTWTNLPFEWGYVDNSGSDFILSERKNYFKISDAVTEDNLHAELPYIDFVKVQTAVNGSSGWLGENSTEVTGFFSLQ